MKYTIIDLDLGNKFGVAESEYELTFFELIKQRLFATAVRLYARANSYLKSATPEI